MTDEAASVNGIAESDFQLWRHHPVSKVFLQFLIDKREFLQRIALHQWIDGGLSLQADQTMRGQIIELAEMAEMPFAGLVNFYHEQKEEDATQASQDHER